MMRIILLPLALVLSIGCGGKIEEVSTGATGTPTAPTATGTSVPPPPGAPGQPAPTPTPPKDPTPSSKKVLTAYAQPGGLDHLSIFAADQTADTCVRIHMTNPFSSGPNDPYVNVTSPKGWGIRDIQRSPGAKRCGPGKQPPAAEISDDAKGSITFAPTSGTYYPCSIDVHVVALFADDPSVEQIDGDKIAVQGCQ